MEKKETHGLETYGGICDGAYADGRRLDISRCCWIAADRCTDSNRGCDTGRRCDGSSFSNRTDRERKRNGQ
ncbi:MAG: hypothetical protein ACLT9J_10610 [Agathobacter rectalis]